MSVVEAKGPINVLKMADRTGFNLGWEWYSYRMSLPELNTSQKSMVDGYNAAKSVLVGPLKHDRFIRKHLLLRFNAWRRGRIFSEEVTPEFIKEIDNNICPVTLKELKHGSSTDDDWSVDRILNDGGYVPGNLIIMSTKVNKAKGDKSFDDIWNIAYNSDEKTVEVEGLSIFEWRRLALICSCVYSNIYDDDPCYLGYAVSPAVGIVPRHIPLNPSVILQVEIARKACGFENKLDKSIKELSPELKKEIGEIVKDAKKQNRRMASLFILDIWHKEKLFNRFADAFRLLNADDRSSVLKPYTEYKDVSGNFSPNFDAMGIVDKGYITA